MANITVRSTDRLTITSPQAIHPGMRLSEDVMIFFGSDQLSAVSTIDAMVSQLLALRRHVLLPGGVAGVRLDGRTQA